MGESTRHKCSREVECVFSFLGQQLERAHRDRDESHPQKIFLNTSPKNQQAEW
ncbi:hypothetical protein DPMN_127960 [Dreissena polymorpha]|uniref:Uncharacterized protein n=1 Tax=Dreissena polymorpha TaxID=45954 RepID=A0A9D4JWZ1_DREPO|nr:hypothetical protein DPMN_127960 [Dreissena polymorpha]